MSRFCRIVFGWAYNIFLKKIDIILRDTYSISSINTRTKWQFFILNKESWIGNPVPVIPMTIDMYSDVMKFIYENKINISDFVMLIKVIHTLSLNTHDFETWYNQSSECITSWKYDVAQICG